MSGASAQFNLNGSATALGSDCYQLTSGGNFVNGSIWSSNLINLQNGFEIYASVNLGGQDTLGGDGIAFAFQQFSNGVNVSGAGNLGISGTNPSMVVEIDTDSNNAKNDIGLDHMALSRNATLNHASANNILGPVSALTNGGNIEDSLAHDLHIKWDQAAQVFSVWFDCDLRLQYNGNIIQDFFFGDPNVYWGFSASSGANANVQSVCLNYISYIDVMPDVYDCQGASVQVTAPYGDIYEWSPGVSLSDSTIFNPVSTPLSNTNYSVTVTDTCGTSYTRSFTHTVVDSIIMEISGDTVVCANTPVTLPISVSSGQGPFNIQLFDGTNLVNYTIDQNGNDINTGQPVIVSSGNSTRTWSIFTASNGLGCSVSLSGSAVVTVGILNGISLSTTSATCRGVCDGETTIIIPHATSQYTYSWSGGYNGAYRPNMCAGNYIVTISDGGNCSATTQLTISEPNSINVQAIPPSQACIGDVTILTANASGGNGGYTYNWSNGDTTTSITISPGTTTAYTVSVTDSLNCPGTSTTTTINVYDTMFITTSPDPIYCIGDSTVMVVNAVGGDGNYTYSWSDGSNQSNTIAGPDTTTTYYVTVDDGCNTSPLVDSVIVFVDTFRAHTYSIIDPVCENTPVRFMLDFYDPASTYLAYFGDGSAGFIQNQVLLHQYPDTGTYDFTLQITSAVCDSVRTDTAAVIINPSPNARFTSTPDEVTTISSPYASFTGTTLNAVDWEWRINGVRVSNSESFTFDFRDSGSYDVQHVAFNSFGCSDTAYGMIQARFEFPVVYVPNAFTPNGDGLNETFAPIITERLITEYELIIYDRWGHVVFYSTTPNEAWDADGVDGNSSQSIFFWKLQFKDINGAIKKQEGTVTMYK